MAKTYVNLADQILVWRNKHNDQENKIGDLAQLTAPLGAANDSDLVTAILHLNTDKFDSATFHTKLTTNYDLSAFDSADFHTALTTNYDLSAFDSSTFHTTLTSNYSAREAGNSLVIYDSSGSIAKTIYSAGAW